MTAPDRYVVEVRPARAGEWCLTDTGGRWSSKVMPSSPVVVIVEELAPPPHPLAGTWHVALGPVSRRLLTVSRSEATHVLTVADDGTCTLTEATS